MRDVVVDAARIDALKIGVAGLYNTHNYTVNLRLAERAGNKIKFSVKLNALL